MMTKAEAETAAMVFSDGVRDGVQPAQMPSLLELAAAMARDYAAACDDRAAIADKLEKATQRLNEVVHERDVAVEQASAVFECMTCGKRLHIDRVRCGDCVNEIRAREAQKETSDANPSDR